MFPVEEGDPTLAIWFCLLSLIGRLQCFLEVPARNCSLIPRRIMGSKLSELLVLISIDLGKSPVEENICSSRLSCGVPGGSLSLIVCLLLTLIV